MLNQIRASIAKAIAPRVSLPGIGTELPQVQLLSQPIVPTASAAAPCDLVRANPGELNSLIRAIAGVSQAMKAGRPAAARPGHAAPARPAPRAAAPASNDDDAPQPDTSGLDSVIKSLMDSVEKLKLMLPADVSADDGDEAQAKAYLATGNKKEALACISRAHTAVGAQVAAQKSRSALRAMPSSRARAAKLTASGFNNDPAVAQLNHALGRGGLSLKSRSEMVLAPVAGHREPARPAAVVPTSAAGDRSKLAALEAEKKNIDEAMRKSGIYDNASIARQSQLSAQILAEQKKILHRQ